MNVWWCQNHNDRGVDEYRCLDEDYEYGDSCDMVEMRLIPKDALVIEKVNSEWPTWAQRAVHDQLNEGDEEAYLQAMWAVAILDAVADASRLVEEKG